MLADLTAKQIRDACDEVYRPDRYRYAPSLVLLDQFAGDPPTTFLRVSFGTSFSERAARRLVQLGAVLQKRHGECSNIVFCIYFGRIDAHKIARHSIAIADK